MTPLTTDEVRNLVALNVMTGELDPEQVERFEAWRRSEGAAVWDKAHALWTGSDHDPNSPYRATGRTRAGSVGSEGVGSVCADGATDSSDERGEG